MKFLRDVDVAELLGVRRGTVWAWVREGRLPQPVRLSARCARWRMEDLEKWEQEIAAKHRRGGGKDENTSNKRKAQKNKQAR